MGRSERRRQERNDKKEINRLKNTYKRCGLCGEYFKMRDLFYNRAELKTTGRIEYACKKCLDELK